MKAASIRRNLRRAVAGVLAMAAVSLAIPTLEASAITPRIPTTWSPSVDRPSLDTSNWRPEAVQAKRVCAKYYKYSEPISIPIRLVGYSKPRPMPEWVTLQVRISNPKGQYVHRVTTLIRPRFDSFCKSYYADRSGWITIDVRTSAGGCKYTDNCRVDLNSLLVSSNGKLPEAAVVQVREIFPSNDPSVAFDKAGPVRMVGLPALPPKPLSFWECVTSEPLKVVSKVLRATLSFISPTLSLAAAFFPGLFVAAAVTAVASLAIDLADEYIINPQGEQLPVAKLTMQYNATREGWDSVHALQKLGNKGAIEFLDKVQAVGGKLIVKIKPLTPAAGKVFAALDIISAISAAQDLNQVLTSPC